MGGAGTSANLARNDHLVHEVQQHVIDLEIDGGITVDTAAEARAAGADVLVAGTAAFDGGSAAYAENIRRLRGDS